MKKLTLNQVTPELSSMFHIDRPTGIRALAVLAGGNQGRILTDDPIQPSWGLVWEADDGILYRGGACSREILNEAVNLLREDGLVALAFRDGGPDLDLFPPDPDAGAECLEFDRPIGASDLSQFLGNLPSGFSLHRMDRSLLERSPKLDENLNRYGSLENLLDKGLAVCVLHNGDVVSEAYADMEVMGVRELGIRTQQAYRRQGLATIACSYLIQLCEEAGSSTYWDCVKLNFGSVSLARKLGFQHQRLYKLLAWFKLKDHLPTV